MKTKAGSLIFLVGIIMFMVIVSSGAYAGTIYGIGSYPIRKENLDNYNNNWPFEVKKQCVAEQSRVVLECSKKDTTTG